MLVKHNARFPVKAHIAFDAFGLGFTGPSCLPFRFSHQVVHAIKPCILWNMGIYWGRSSCSSRPLWFLTRPHEVGVGDASLEFKTVALSTAAAV